MKNLDGVQQKYDFFLNMHEMGVKNYVPMYRIREEKISIWFNRKCAAAKQQRDRA